MDMFHEKIRTYLYIYIDMFHEKIRTIYFRYFKSIILDEKSIKIQGKQGLKLSFA